MTNFYHQISPNFVEIIFSISFFLLANTNTKNYIFLLPALSIGMRSVAWQYKTLKLILLLNEIMSTVTLLRLSLLIVGKNRFLKENQVNVMQILQLKFRFNFKFI